MTVNGNPPDTKGNVKITIPEVVSPSVEGAGKAADAKATHEALETKVAKSELESLVVAPDSSAKTGQVADAKATYEELKDKRSLDDLDYTRTETSLEPGYVLEIYNLDKTQLLNTVNLKLISERHSGAFVTKVWEYRTDNTQYQLTGELAGYDSYDWRFIASDEYGIFFAPTWHTSLLDGLETDHTVTGTNCVYELQYSESIEFTNPVDDKLALESQVPAVVSPSEGGTGKAADAKAVYEGLLEKVDKPTTPPNGVVYPNEVQLENGGFYLIGANSSNNCNAYLPNVDSYEPQTFIIYCKDGTSSRFIDHLGRRVITNIHEGVFSDSVNFRFVGLPTNKFVSVTMRRVQADDGEEMIHLEIV